MEIRIKTGKLTNNIDILNTYAPVGNRDFSEITGR